jgi:hypothetical protein
VEDQPGADRPPHVETVESDDEDEDLIDGDTLSKGEEGSPYGGCSQFRPPTLAGLVELGHPQCRAPTQVTATDRAKVTCIYSCLVGDCQWHATHRISQRYCHPPGWFLCQYD